MSEPWQLSPRLRLLACGLLVIASCAAPARADDAIVGVLTLELAEG